MSQDDINHAVQQILNEAQDQIVAILLFGSHADNTPIWRSDIDIAVIFKEDLTNLEAGLFRKKMMGILPEKIDLQVFNVLPLKVKRSIAENHKVLFQSKEFDRESFINSNQKLFFELQRRIAAAGMV